MATSPAECERELFFACAEFHRIDRGLGPDDPTPREWLRAAIRRDDAMRGARKVAPGSELLAREQRADVVVMEEARLRIGRQRIASLAGRLFRTDLPARTVLGLCLDHNRAHYGLADAEVERVVRWVAGREADRLEAG